jgi:hypothetical protein
MSVDQYQFDIVDGEVTTVYERNDQGEWVEAPIDTNTTYAVDDGQITRTEVEDGVEEVETFTDPDGDGIYTEHADDDKSSTQYRFDLVDDQIATIYVLDDQGEWVEEPVDDNVTYELSADGQITRTEMEDGAEEVSILTDEDGDDIFTVQGSDDDAVDDSLDTNDETTPFPGADSVEHSLARLYMAIFDRSPDAEGFAHWEQKLAEGESFDGVVDAFIASDEFEAQYGNLDNPAFLARLYQLTLDREPDDEGFGYWVSQLARGEMDRAEVVKAFADSDEFKALSADEVEAFLAVYGDDVGTDTEDEGADTSESASDDATVDGDQSSDETSDEVAIDSDSMVDEEVTTSVETTRGDDAALARTYMAAFDRAPDEQGFSYWAQELDKKMTLEQVIDQFVQSEEFQETYGEVEDSAFVTELYQNALERAPDSEGLGWWVSQLASGESDWSDVILGFVESEEFAEQAADEVDGFLDTVGQSPKVEDTVA